MEQVGYDTYCKLLDEVMKEMQGIELKEEQDVQIDINVSSYIPDSFLSESSQKIEIYQNIALCRTEEDIQNVIDEIIDRYGKIPNELENLLEIARIKEAAKKVNIIKIAQRMQSVIFYFNKDKIKNNMVEKLIQKYGMQIKFSTGIEPYVTLRLKEEISDKQILQNVKEMLEYVKSL